MGVRTEHVQPGNIGATLEGLAGTIRGRRDADPRQSYTARLLAGEEDSLLKKIVEEAGDLIYHLLVVLERYGVGLDELAGELDARMH